MGAAGGRMQVHLVKNEHAARDAVIAAGCVVGLVAAIGAVVPPPAAAYPLLRRPFCNQPHGRCSRCIVGTPGGRSWWRTACSESGRQKLRHDPFIHGHASRKQQYTASLSIEITCSTSTCFRKH